MARGARALSPVENQPTAHRALPLHAAHLAQLFARPTRDALHSVRLAEAPLRLHRARLAATASHRQSRFVLVPWRGPRALRHVENQPTAHRALSLHDADLARLSARPTRDALHPARVAEAPLRLHRNRSASAASRCRSRLFLVPWRAARAR